MRWDVINRVGRLIGAKRYLEIGVFDGACMAQIAIPERWGVDPAPRRGARTHATRFFEQTSNAFFDALGRSERFDLVFIDGLHHAAQVMRDAEQALEHLTPGGVVLLHDCNPLTEAAQRVPRMQGLWNGDCWKALVGLRERRDVAAAVLDTDHGIGVLTRGLSSPLALDRTWGKLRYRDLTKHRESLLGLVPERMLLQRLLCRMELRRRLELRLWVAIPTMSPRLVHDAAKAIADTASSPVSLALAANGCELDPEGFTGFEEVRVVSSAENRGTVPALDALSRAVADDADVVLFLHDDVTVRQRGWDDMLRDLFSSRPAAAIAGFAGGPRIGLAGMYERPFDVEAPRRHGTYSNLVEASRWGSRLTSACRSAGVDGLALAVRASFLKDVKHWSWWPLPHHGYDRAICLEAIRRDREVWFVPVVAHHAAYGTSRVAGRPFVEAQGGYDKLRHGADRLIYERYRRSPLPYDVEETL